MVSASSLRAVRLIVWTLYGLMAVGAGSNNPASTSQPESQPGTLVSYLGNPAYPDGFWTATTPAASKVDVATLEQAVEMSASSQLEIHSFIVAREGRIVFEQYGWSSGSNVDDPNRTPHQVVPTERYPVNSTTKSFLATLVGIAIGDGLLADRSAWMPEFILERLAR
jgi:CubicO group peptidase (beta-lactamase class C family)